MHVTPDEASVLIEE